MGAPQAVQNLYLSRSSHFASCPLFPKTQQLNHQVEPRIHEALLPVQALAVTCMAFSKSSRNLYAYQKFRLSFLLYYWPKIEYIQQKQEFFTDN